MNVTAFVGISSLVLVVWLGLAFFREVPSQRYQPAPAAGNNPPADNAQAPRLAIGEKISD